MPTLTPKQAVAAIDIIEARYQQRLVAPYAERIQALTSHLAEDLNRAATIQKKFRGFLEPFARELVVARIAATLAAIYIASLEQPGPTLEFQDASISVVWNQPPSEAIRYLTGKRIVTRKTFDFLTESERRYAFTVSRVSEEKLLGDIHDRILNNLKLGRPRRELEKDLQQLLPDFVKHRIELIANQNLRQATMQGRFEQMWRTRQLLPYAQWKTMRDDRVRPEHRALHNQIWRLEQIPFWPPLGFNCRCWVIQLSERKIQGRQVIAGPGEYKTIDGDTLFVGNVSDADAYRLNNQSIFFPMASRPQPIDRPPARIVASAAQPTPLTISDLENAIRRFQPKLAGSKESIARFVWNYNDPRYRGWWDPVTRTLAIHRDVSLQIERALAKLAQGEPLLFDEANALRTLWHEINHTRGSQVLPATRVQRAFLEVVNELHTRLRFEQFIRQLGYDPKLANPDAVLAVGTGYEGLAITMRRIFEAAGIGVVEATAFFEQLNVHRHWSRYLDRILAKLSDQLQLSLTEKEILKIRLHEGALLDDFGRALEFVSDLAGSKGIKPARWF